MAVMFRGVVLFIAAIVVCVFASPVVIDPVCSCGDCCGSRNYVNYGCSSVVPVSGCGCNNQYYSGCGCGNQCLGGCGCGNQCLSGSGCGNQCSNGCGCGYPVYAPYTIAPSVGCGCTNGCQSCGCSSCESCAGCGCSTGYNPTACLEQFVVAPFGGCLSDCVSIPPLPPVIPSGCGCDFFSSYAPVLPGCGCGCGGCGCGGGRYLRQIIVQPPFCV